jgi:hypothetical protein
MPRRVRGCDGREWTVKREWLHRRPRWRSKVDGGDALESLELLEPVGLAADIPAIGIVIVSVFAVVSALLFAWFFVIPAIIFIGEFVWILVVALVGIALRFGMRHPWTVVAATKDAPPEAWEVRVVGFKTAGAKIDELAYQIEETGTPVRP